MSRRVRIFALLVAYTIVSAGIPAATHSSSASGPEAPLFVFSRVDPELKSYGFIDLRLKWPTPIVKVCWESLESERASKIVEVAVEDTWQKAANIQFTGWKRCGADENGIRIVVVDEAHAPDSKVGTDLDSVLGGMRLNFTFRYWGGPMCQSQPDVCIRNVAVHEFGHALGFLHESKRPDIPEDCKTNPYAIGDHSLADGEKVTPYDPDSVMNYCNQVWLNNGQLSAHDIQAAQLLYGRPTE